MSEVELMIVATEAKHACEHETDLRAKCLAAMKAARNHWMVTDEDKQFRGAIAGVMLALGEGADRDALEQEMRAINAMNALFSGLPIDIERVQMPENPLKLIQLWRETA